MKHVCLIEARRGDNVLKCARVMPEDWGPNEVAAFRAEVSGFFRVVYREWAETFRERTTLTRNF